MHPIFMIFTKERRSMFDNLSTTPNCVIFGASVGLSKLVKADYRFQQFKFDCYHFSSEGKPGVKAMNSSDEVTNACGEVTILAGRSALNGLARYPYRSKYVIFQINFLNIYFYIGLAGLLRRFVYGRRDKNCEIKLRSLVAFSRSPFAVALVLENPNASVTNHYSLDETIGYEGFLNFLNQSRKKYVVLRFFEKLPLGGRPGGDLDILVDDELEGAAADFLLRNPGRLMVDMYSVRGPSDAARIPYHVPVLSKKILNEAVKFNGYSVPSGINYLHSFIYHCLYHKGISSGIPSTHAGVVASKNPDNDYLGKIEELSRIEDVAVGTNLEELDEYMESVGWRPHLDTLELLAKSNKWLAKHLEKTVNRIEYTLIACVLKEGFFAANTCDRFEKSLQKNGFAILQSEKLDGNRQIQAATALRGGNWSSTNEPKYLPKHLYILYDATLRGSAIRKYNLNYDPRPIKNVLRKKYDGADQSFIHMTDNTAQTVEYLKEMYPATVEAVYEDIMKTDLKYSQHSLKLYLWKILFQTKSMPRRILSIVNEKIRSLI